MTKMRLIGLGMFLYGGVWLVLLFTPWRQWALEHSIAEAVSTARPRAGSDRVETANVPMAIAGSAVMMFAGAWFGVLVPWVVGRSHRQAREAFHARYYGAAAPDASAPR